MKTLEEIKEIMRIQKALDEMKVKEYWENFPEFYDENQVPNLPIPLTEFHVKQLVKAGAIAKKDLKNGTSYLGKCRNAHEAILHADKNVFIYKIHKFGDIFDEDINHFEDDNGYDLFVPIKEID